MSRAEEHQTGTIPLRVLQTAPKDEDRHHSDFARDVLLGLHRTPKSIPSRYFYDEEGNRLFRRIMNLPEYYLTDCEMEILRTQGANIAGHLGEEQFNLVELGAGDGKKTRVLLEHFTKLGLDFRYVPIDICEPALEKLVEHCDGIHPGLRIDGLVSEYFEGLSWLAGLNGRRNVVLFLGSNIGNFSAAESRTFLHSLWNSLGAGDFVLIGFDLKKEIDIMSRAYNDAEGVTAAFNLNLLSRINRELGGEFDIDRFEHYSTYNVRTGAMESYLLSRAAQSVFVRDIDCRFDFAPLEPIHTEVSQKYLETDIRRLADDTGFRIVDQLRDSGNCFVDSLWRTDKASPC